MNRRQFFLGSSALAVSAMAPPSIVFAAPAPVPVTATGISILMRNAQDEIFDAINRRALAILQEQMRPIVDAWAEQLMTSGSLPDNTGNFVRIRRPRVFEVNP